MKDSTSVGDIKKLEKEDVEKVMDDMVINGYLERGINELGERVIRITPKGIEESLKRSKNSEFLS